MLRRYLPPPGSQNEKGRVAPACEGWGRFLRELEHLQYTPFGKEVKDFFRAFRAKNPTRHTLGRYGARNLTWSAPGRKRTGVLEPFSRRILAEAIRMETTLWIGALFHLNGIPSNAVKTVPSHDLQGADLVSAFRPKAIFIEQALRSGTIAHKTSRSAHAIETKFSYGCHRSHDIPCFANSHKFAISLRTSELLMFRNLIP